MRIRPKYRRNFYQALSFAVIWLVFGLVYVSLERGLLGDSPIYPGTGNMYDFKTSLIYTAIGSFIIGFLQGWIEVAWLKNLFNKNPFWNKILFKGLFYTLLIIIFLATLTLIINSARFNAGILDAEVVNSLKVFMSKFSFWSVVIYMAVVVDVALFFSEVRDFLGGGIYYNYSFGTYHKPKTEKRIFMFLDMKSSTTIAEKLGHQNYFKLIKSYYADMTDALLETNGTIYQYVGDEIVVSWPEKEGLKSNNCLLCFQKIEEAIDTRSAQYQSEFGFVPEFKAGIHIGTVTAGEIGTLKKEIVYTGDVLNTAARIQALCNQYNARILISAKLKSCLDRQEEVIFSEIGTITLRGKTVPMPLFKVEFDELHISEG